MTEAIDAGRLGDAMTLANPWAARFPVARRSWGRIPFLGTGAGAPRRRRKGLILGDQRTHAAKLTVTGARALCGTGRVLAIPDRFDPDERGACHDCAERSRSTRSGRSRRR